MTPDADTGHPDTTTDTGHELRGLARRSLTIAAALVRLLTVVFAAILVIHVVLTVAVANPGNHVTTFFAAAANHLTLELGSLFLTSSPSLQVILNYGLPAVIWLIIGLLAARVMQALTP